MKSYSLPILILFLFSQSALSVQPKVKFRKLDNDLITSYEIFDHKISNNSFIHGMYISKARILIDQENMLVQMLAWIKGNNEAAIITNYLSYDHCDMIYKTLMEGMAISINTYGAEVNLVDSNPKHLYNYTANDVATKLNVYWDPIKVDADDFFINISCQGNVQNISE